MTSGGRREGRTSEGSARRFLSQGVAQREVRARLTLEEELEDTASLLVDEARDTLHSTSAGQTPDGGLGDALDVVAKDLAVTLGSSLSESLSSTSRSSPLRLQNTLFIIYPK